MSYTVLADKSVDEHAWLDAHREGVSATEVATLVRGGAGAWAAVRAQKDGVRIGRSEAMRYGTEREPVIAQFAYDVFGLIPCQAILAQDDNPLYRASPDALSADGSTVGEFKTTKHDWDTWDDVPPRYRDQMLWQMFVTGARKGVLVFEPHDGFVPLYPFPKHFTLDYDAERVEELRAVADEFMQGVVASPEAVELDALLTARVNAKADAQAAAAAVDEIDAQIRALAHAVDITRFEGSAANMTLSADTVARRFDSAGFKKAHPGTYAAFVNETPVKGRLTVTER